MSVITRQFAFSRRQLVRMPSSVLKPSITSTSRPLQQKRAFSNLPSLRPTLAPAASRSSLFPNTFSSRLIPQQQQAVAEAAGTADVVAKGCITNHPALAAAQIRCGPRPNLNPSSRLIQKRRHGFLGRLRTRGGRNIIKRRKQKGRKVMSR